MSSLWRTEGGGKWEIEQYSGRPGTTIKRFVSLLLYFWGGIKDYDDDCADIEIRQFCGCQPASIWLNGFYITKLLQLLPSATNTHPDFLQENGKIQHHISSDRLLDLWKWTVTYHPSSSEPLNCGYPQLRLDLSHWASLHIQLKQFKHRLHKKSRKVCSFNTQLNLWLPGHYKVDFSWDLALLRTYLGRSR